MEEWSLPHGRCSTWALGMGRGCWEGGRGWKGGSWWFRGCILGEGRTMWCKSLQLKLLVKHHRCPTLQVASHMLQELMPNSKEPPNADLPRKKLFVRLNPPLLLLPLHCNFANGNFHADVKMSVDFKRNARCKFTIFVWVVCPMYTYPYQYWEPYNFKYDSHKYAETGRLQAC